MEVGRAHPQDQATLAKVAKTSPEPPKDTAAPANGHAKKVDRKPCKKNLQVKLTDAELAKKAREVASAWGEVEVAEEKLKGLVKRDKQKIKDLKLAHAQIVRVISAGSEERSVQCEEVFNWDKRIVEVHRLDLPEDHKERIVQRRAITEAESQFPLPFAGDKSAAALKNEPPQAKKENKARFHGDGKECNKAACKRTHYDEAVIKKALDKVSGQKPGPEDEPQPKAAKDKEDWRGKDPKKEFRGKHTDGEACYKKDCADIHVKE